MTEYRSLLENDLRLAGPAGFSLDDLARRRSRKQRNRRVGTAAVALVLATAAIGIVVRTVPQDRAPRPADLPTTPDAWTRYEPGEMRIDGITAGGPGLVAVGWDEQGAAAWTSSDGRTWTEVPPEELGVGTISAVTAGGPGLVAVGTTDNELRRILGKPAQGPTHTVVWTSEDGRSWTRLPEDPVFRDAGFGPSALTTGGPGVVAVGDANSAWFSSDGTRWERAEVPPVPADVYPGDDGQTPQIHLRDVAAGGDRLVASGWKMDDDPEAPVIWTSANGRSWADVPLDPEVFPRGATISGLTHGPNGFVAVGNLAQGTQPTAWTSADGRRWQQISDREAFASRVASPGRSTAVWSVTASEQGYVATGVDGLCSTEGRCGSAEAAIWTSRDGEAWIRVPAGTMFRAPARPDVEGSDAWRVITWRSRFVVVGKYDGRRAIWISDGATSAG